MFTQVELELDNGRRFGEALGSNQGEVWRVMSASMCRFYLWQ